MPGSSKAIGYSLAWVKLQVWGGVSALSPCPSWKPSPPLSLSCFSSTAGLRTWTEYNSLSGPGALLQAPLLGDLILAADAPPLDISLGHILCFSSPH